MSRGWAGASRSEGWVMRCDRSGQPCKTRSEVQPTQHDLPLDRFAREGWFIAVTHGDLCPSCVGDDMAAIIATRAARGGPGAPHPLMARYV